MKLVPLYDRILVKKDNEKVSSGGIIFVENSQKENSHRGRVVAIGEGRVSELTKEIAPLRLKIGDYVVFPRWAGNEVSVDGEKVVLLKEEDVEALIAEEA